MSLDCLLTCHFEGTSSQRNILRGGSNSRLCVKCCHSEALLDQDQQATKIATELQCVFVGKCVCRSQNYTFRHSGPDACLREAGD